MRCLFLLFQKGLPKLDDPDLGIAPTRCCGCSKLRCGSDAFVAISRSMPLSGLCRIRSLQCFAAFFPELGILTSIPLFVCLALRLRQSRSGDRSHKVLWVFQAPLWERRLRRDFEVDAVKRSLSYSKPAMFRRLFSGARHFDFDSVVRMFSITTSTIAIWGSLPQTLSLADSTFQRSRYRIALTMLLYPCPVEMHE